MFGAYVSSLSTSIGWGGQGGSMQLKLVEDVDKGVVIPKFDKQGNRDDANGQPFTGGHIESPEVGSACYFKYQNFYFGGIFQRWTYQESTSGRTYDVVLESPSKLMDGVQLIVGDFNGMSDRYLDPDTNSTNAGRTIVNYADIANVYNIFGVFENDLDGYFGSSQFNTAGMKVNMLIYALNVIASRPYGPSAGNPNGFGGPIQFKDTNYDLNVTLLKGVIDDVWGAASFSGFDGVANIYTAPEAYRVKGPVMTIEGFVKDITEALQLDYYYDVRHIGYDEASMNSTYSDGGGLIPDAEININLVSKASPPNPGAIQEYITAQKDSGKVVSYSVGQEFGDAVTQKMIWGGNRTRYQWIPTSLCYPVWGKMENGGLLTSNLRSAYYIQGSSGSMFGTGIEKTNLWQTVRLNKANDYRQPYYYASLFEIRMALGGKECWEIFKTFETLSGVEPNGENDITTCPWTAQFDVAKDFLELLYGGSANCFDFINTNTTVAAKQTQTKKNEEADKLFQLVSGVASNFYCQQFVAPLLSDVVNNVPLGRLLYAPPGEFQVWKAWEISDSAFLEDKLCKDLNFFDGNGKQKSMSAWRMGANYDYSNLGSDYDMGIGAAAGNIVSTKGSPDKDQFFQFAGSDTLYVLFQAGGQVKHFDSITTPDFGLTVLAKYFWDLDIHPIKYIAAGKQSLQFAVPPDVAVPQRFGVPQDGTRHKYGPWLGGFNLRGKAEVSGDESLLPETFGGFEALRSVGSLQANLGTSDMTANESGMLEIVGAPEGNIGQRFAASGPYVTNLDINVDTGGIKTTYKFNTWTPTFGKLAKYNIDRMARIGKNQFDMMKRNRDRVEKRPFPKIKFEKTDFDILSARFSRTDVSGVSFNVKGGAEVNVDNKGKAGGGNAQGDAGKPNKP